MSDDLAKRRWADAQLALALFCISPAQFGGVRLLSWASEPRRAWLQLLKTSLPEQAPLVTLPVGADDGQLLGSVDLAYLAEQQRLVLSSGLLSQAHQGVLVVRMAERLPLAQEAIVCSAMDQGRLQVEREGLSTIAPAQFGCVALDEGVTGEEGIGEALADRLAFTVDLHAVSPSLVVQGESERIAAADIRQGAQRLGQVRIPPSLLPALCQAAWRLNIRSVRAPLYAQRVAAALAALYGSDTVTEAHAETAVRLVYGARARDSAPPQPERADAGEPPPQPDQPPSDQQDNITDPAEQDASAPLDSELAEQLIAAAQAAVPAGLLETLRYDRRRRKGEGSGGRFGPPRESRRRGAPLGSRPGSLREGAKLDVPATLRRAAPWQALRRHAANATGPRPLIEVDDLCARRFRQHAPTVTLFVVDASGSAARARLAEAKGAVEELLGECYIRRDQVGLIAFRGADAELLLPPTRSLLRARRALVGLAGGGGTPLARGLREALVLAQRLQRSGAVPVLVLVTDGRPNVDLEGRGGRQQAMTDARAMARALGHADCASLVVDSSARGQPFAQELAGLMRGEYLLLPRTGDTSLGRQVAALGRSVASSAQNPRKEA